MAIHSESQFEIDVCTAMHERGWLYEHPSAERYDAKLTLFTEDLVAFVRETQPIVFEQLTKAHGANADTILCERVRTMLDKQGTLDVLRNGVEVFGVNAAVNVVQFAPAFGMNGDIVRRYMANRLRIVRQVKYSTKNENSIDLVLFVNGIPTATVELKTDYTQAVQDAVRQYKEDRQPKGEPLLTFPCGALVHFAVSNSEVYMTTKLSGAATTFLPFNRGNNGASGNPPNPNGYATSYLWEDVFAPNSWLDILQRYIVMVTDSMKKPSNLIFPRFHQLDVTRKLIKAISAQGSGARRRYLIQHSAGSGKTNSIAWTTHFLSTLHDEHDNKMFDSIIVVSDRNVLDAQLSETIESFERTKGVVKSITGDSGSKSSELAEALDDNKRIIICTIQTFPFALQTVRELASTKGKRFVVIADEAHSSQSGQAASKLKATLNAQELADLEDGGEVSSEDVLAAEMSARVDDTGITFIAFTATPKAKTLELFGVKPSPELPPGPFHVYSMRQAIEEGFILDVLKNYTPWSLAFKVGSTNPEWVNREVDEATAKAGIMRWVRLHPHNIASRVEVVVEHFRENVAPLLNGHAKAMVVTSSRLEAVRWKFAMDSYLRQVGAPYQALVAFSGEVTDHENSLGPFTEKSSGLNSGLQGRDIREAFDTDTFRILIVANKFQTGFDQPLLCGMYVDKRLGGIQAVQTLSRLNRSYKGPLGQKDTTYVLDFQNQADEILEAFSTYYETAELSAETDPTLLLDIKASLDASGRYDQHEVERVVKVVLNPGSRQQDLDAAIQPVAQRLLMQFRSAQDAYEKAEENNDAAKAETALNTMDLLLKFKGSMGAYLRLYTFLSQMYNYGLTDVEKKSIFYHYLIKLLTFGLARPMVDLSQIQLTHYALRKKQATLTIDDTIPIDPPTETGSGGVREAPKDWLYNIISRINDLFEGELTDGDMISYVTAIRTKLLESEILQTQARNNTKTQFQQSPDLQFELQTAIMAAMDAHGNMSKQALDDPKILLGILRALLDHGGLYEGLRG